LYKLSINFNESISYLMSFISIDFSNKYQEGSNDECIGSTQLIKDQISSLAVLDN